MKQLAANKFDRAVKRPSRPNIMMLCYFCYLLLCKARKVKRFGTKRDVILSVDFIVFLAWWQNTNQRQVCLSTSARAGRGAGRAATSCSFGEQSPASLWLVQTGATGMCDMKRYSLTLSVTKLVAKSHHHHLQDEDRMSHLPLNKRWRVEGPRYEKAVARWMHRKKWLFDKSEMTYRKFLQSPS